MLKTTTYTGKLERIHDLVDFQYVSTSEVEKAFHEAVDDYLVFCKDNGCAPDKPDVSKILDDE